MKISNLRGRRTRAQVLILLIVCAVIIGFRLILVSHAATPYASVSAGAGKLVGLATLVTDPSADTGSAVSFSTVGSASATPLLGAVGYSSTTDASLFAAGFRGIVIGLDWAAIEPSEGVFSSTALATAQNAITTAITNGLRPTIDLGLQYAPAWIFSVGGGTQFVDQYGDVFSGTNGSGNDVPNGVTDTAVRTQIQSYLQYLGNHLVIVNAVRVGGGPYNELRYPSGSSGSTPNAYWFYDSSSQASLPVSLRGWTPTTGSVAQATNFLTAYNQALVNYGVWQVQTAEAAFPSSVKIEVLLPGWGERPNEIAAAENGLLANTPDEINQGLDWSDLLPVLPDPGRVVAYSTWADAATGGSSNPDPAAFIHQILPASMLAGGESTGNGNTTNAGMHLMFEDAKNWNWYAVNWYIGGQPQTLEQVDASFLNP